MQINGLKKQGVTLVETLVYVTLLSLLTVGSMSALMLFNQSLQGVVLGRIVDDTAQEVMEKIVREIRFADSVDLTQSTMSVNPSILVLNSSDVSGTSVEVGFALNGSTLEFSRDGVVVGPLTPNQVTIDELIFDHIVTSHSEAVKVSLVLKASRGAVQVEEPFNTTVLLRGSY